LLYSTQFFTIHRVPSSLFFPRLVVTYLYPDGAYAVVAAFLVETALIGYLIPIFRNREKLLNESNK